MQRRQLLSVAFLVLCFCFPLITGAQTRTSLTSNNTSACDASGTQSHCAAAFPGLLDSTRQQMFDPPGRNVGKGDIHQMIYSGATTKVMTALVPWWCMTSGSSVAGVGTSCNSHLQIGYNSVDARTATAQVDDMMQRGFDGAVMAYYGQLKFYNDSTLRVRDAAEARCTDSGCPFNFAVMEDEGALQWTKCPKDGSGIDQTDCLAQALNGDLDYMDANYFPYRSYLRVDPVSKNPSAQGRPVVLFFICEECWTNPAPNWGNVWATVRAHSMQLNNGNGLFIFRNAPGFAHAESDGAFAWVNWYGADPYGLKYLANFYSASAQSANFSKLTWGGAWKGFNDVDAGWAPTPSRYMGQQCGNTWLQTLAAAQPTYSAANPLPFMMLGTWNDYEEGTEIESGIDNCLSLPVSVSGSTLTWTPTFSDPSGSEATVAQYEVYDSADGENLTKLATLPVSTHSLNLSTTVNSPGSHTLYVRAVGKNSIANVMSNAVQYGVTAAPSLAPSTLSFGTVVYGATSSAKTLTLKNSGTAQLQITGVAISTGFTQTNNCGSSLAAGASCTLQVAFAPRTKGSITGTVTVSTDASPSTLSASLSGTATYVTASATSLNFVTRTVGTTSGSQTVKVYNKGPAVV